MCVRWQSNDEHTHSPSAQEKQECLLRPWREKATAKKDEGEAESAWHRPGPGGDTTGKGPAQETGGADRVRPSRTLEQKSLHQHQQRIPEEQTMDSPKLS